MLIWCDKYKLNVNVEQNCKDMCIFWDKENNKCHFKNWYPGLKKGRNLTDENIK